MGNVTNFFPSTPSDYFSVLDTTISNLSSSFFVDLFAKQKTITYLDNCGTAYIL